LKLSKAIELLERCAEDSDWLVEQGLESEDRERSRGTAEGFRRAIEVVAQVTELDGPAVPVKSKSGLAAIATLIVNARKVYVDDHMPLTYQAVAILALGDKYRSKVLYTITGQHDGRGFGMVPGDEVDALDGMIFSVADTSNA
jgi:hypothetical protein